MSEYLLGHWYLGVIAFLSIGMASFLVDFLLKFSVTGRVLILTSVLATAVIYMIGTAVLLRSDWALQEATFIYAVPAAFAVLLIRLVQKNVQLNV